VRRRRRTRRGTRDERPAGRILGAPPATAPTPEPPATGQDAPTSTTAPPASTDQEPLPEDDAAPELDGSNLPQGVPGALPDGADRVVITEADLAGVPAPDELRDSVDEENVGRYTWHLSAGRFRGDQQADPPPVIPEIEGTYVVEGDTVTFYFPSGMTFDLSTAEFDQLPPAPVEKFRWRRAADGSLRFTPLDGVDPLAAAVIASHPWQPGAAATV
jgi:hypothetical protein